MDNDLNNKLYSLADKYLANKDWADIAVHEVNEDTKANKSIGKAIKLSTTALIVGSIIIVNIPLLSLV